ALQGVLRLYNMASAYETDQMIAAIADVSATTGIARVGDSMISGTDVAITFDPDLISPTEAYGFATVLDRFLGAYTTLNTYTRLTVQMAGQPDRLARFAARAGEGVFL
ncbi:MAG: type VI secretion system baseplate subunit TssF, partial [Pseudomonadota bacterium]